MNGNAQYDRIISDPAVLLGKPVIRGTRVPAYLIAGLVEAGQTPESIVDDYPDLTVEDVDAAIEFVAQELARAGANTN